MSNGISENSLKGKLALVTGSSRGIGEAIALRLAQAGANVVVHCTGNRERAEQVCQKISQLGSRTLLIQEDLGTLDAPQHIYDQIVQKMGPLDIFVSNVAVQFPEAWQKVSRSNFDTQVRVNWQSAFEMIQLFSPHMIEQKWGRILCIGSVQERVPHPDMVVYSALKAAQSLMVKNLAKQLAVHGVTINNLAPGVIATDRSLERLEDPVYLQTVLNKIPSHTLGQPEDCSELAHLICSDGGRYITGQDIFVDGGMGC